MEQTIFETGFTKRPGYDHYLQEDDEGNLTIEFVKENKAYEIFRTAIIWIASLMASVAIAALIYGFFTGQLI